MFGADLEMKPKKGKKSHKIRVYSSYSKIEYKLPYPMTREELVDKILTDVKFREEMKQELEQREFRIIINSL